MAIESRQARVQDMLDLSGKVAVVTGAHEWLGYDMASALAEFGCAIVVTSRSLERAEETASRIASEYGVEALGLDLDQRGHESVAAMARAARAWKGQVDILINNAGGGSGASEGELFKRSPEDIAAMIETNLTGVLYCCQEIGRGMMERGSGKIVNVASIAGLVGRDRAMYRRTGKMEQPVDYAAAKGGVIGLTRDLAGLMSPRGICVNSISPGGFDKGDLPPEFVRAYSDETMLGRMGRMGADIKGAALFLSSAASDYVTGHNLVVDGGFSAWK